jgi:Cytochrome P460
MKTMKVVAIGTAGISAMVAVAAYGQMDTTASSNEPKAEAVVDAAGNLRVPDAYRTTYQSLGSWAVAADQGKGSKELHVVYASPGTIAAYRKDGGFPDGAVLVKEVFETATGQMTTGTVSHAETLKG